MTFPTFLKLSCVLTALLLVANGITFPPPTGPYNTSLTITQLTDNGRIDPFSPTNSTRTLMISIFQPVQLCSCVPTTVPYMDTLTATYEDEKFSQYGLPAGTFSSLNLAVCSTTKKSNSRITSKPQNFPVVVFSPGLGTSRLVYSVIAQQLSSKGYIVITVDHPYDVDIVSFPNNDTILGLDIPDEQIPLALTTRVADISFILNELSRPSVCKVIFPGSSLNTSKVGIYGHSLGGATAAQAMLSDSRLVAGVNLDGTFFGSVVETGFSKLFLIFAHEGKNRTTDYSWEAIWPKLTGWKRELTIEGTAHYSFSDLVGIVDVLGLRDMLPEEAGEMIGTIGGRRVLDVVTSYLGEFFGEFLKGEEGELLDGGSDEFPEVTFEL